MRFTTWCCWVRRKASRNFLHCSSEVRRSITASVLLYAALTSPRMSSYCLWVSTPRLSSSPSSPKSGSMMSDSRDLKFTMESKMWGENEAPAISTIHWIVRLNNWIKSELHKLFFSKCRTLKSGWPWNPGQRSLKVIEYGTIRYMGYGFLLVFYSNFALKTNVLRDIQLQKNVVTRIDPRQRLPINVP